MNHPYYHTYSEHPLIPTHEESWVIENLLNNEPLPAIYDTVLRTNPRGDQKQHKHLYTYAEDQIGRRTYMNPAHIAAKAATTANPLPHPKHHHRRVHLAASNQPARTRQHQTPRHPQRRRLHPHTPNPALPHPTHLEPAARTSTTWHAHPVPPMD